MPITASDVKFRGSTSLGTAGNVLPYGGSSASLGYYICSDNLTSGSLNNLFDDITSAENSASQVDYRCLFIYNSGTSTWTSPIVYLSADVAGGATFAIAIDTFSASPVGQTSQQALSIATTTTAPGGVTFTAPTTYATGLSLGNLSAGYCRAIWIKRTASNTSQVSNDGTTIMVIGT